MATQIFINNFRTTVASTFGVGDPYLQITDATGLPDLVGDQFYKLTLYRLTGVEESGHEVVNVTARTGTQLTVTRGVEGAAPSVFLAGSKVEARVTKGSLEAKADAAAMATALAGKADSATTTAALATKADDTATTTALAGKASIGYVDTSLAAHAAASDPHPQYTTDAEVAAAIAAATSPDATQAEAEAGTGTAIRRWTPQRVKQAINALAPITGGMKTTPSGVIDPAVYNVFMNYSGSVTLPDLSTILPTFGLSVLANSLAVPATATTTDGWTVTTGFVAGTQKHIAPIVTGTPHGHWGNLSMSPPLLATSPTIGSGGALTLVASVSLSATCLIFIMSESGVGQYAIAYDPTTDTWGSPVTLFSTTGGVPSLHAVSATSFLYLSITSAIACSLSGVTITKGTVLTLGAAMNSYAVQLTSTTYLLRLNMASDMVVLTVAGTTCSVGTSVASGAGISQGVNLRKISATAVLINYTSTTTNPATLKAAVVSISGTTVSMGVTASASGADINGNTPGSLLPLSATNFILCCTNTTTSTSGSWYGITVSGTTVTIGAVQIVASVIAPYTGKNNFILPFKQGASTTGWDKGAAIDSTTGLFVIGAPSNALVAVSMSGTTLTFGAVYNTGAPYSVIPDAATGANLYAIGASSIAKLSISGVTISAAYTVANSPTAVFSDTLTDKAVSYAGSWYAWTGLPTLLCPISTDKFLVLSSNTLKCYGNFS